MGAFDPYFHPHSFGFRPGRSAHDAVEGARQFIADGAAWYADDGRIYVASERAGQRVMESVTRYIEQRLKLKINREKSVVDKASKRALLGFRFHVRGSGEVRVLVDPKARKRAKDRLRALTARKWSVSMQRRVMEINRFTVGWTAYFALADTPRPFKELDGWLRRRLRQVRWKEWKRVWTKVRHLMAAGIPREDALSWGTRARATGASPALQSSIWCCTTPTGPTRA